MATQFPVPEDAHAYHGICLSSDTIIFVRMNGIRNSVYTILIESSNASAEDIKYLPEKKDYNKTYRLSLSLISAVISDNKLRHKTFERYLIL